MIMSAHIIDGNAIAADLRDSLAEKVVNLSSQGRRPGLAVVLVGENPASISYVTAKERDCEKVGILSRDIRLPGDTSQVELLRLLRELNDDDSLHGILVQLPLPGHIDEEKVIRTIPPDKDVDGFHPENIGKLVLNLGGFLPCTPHGVIKLLEANGTTIAGAEVVVIGRSRIVGAPLANLMFRKAPGGKRHGNGLSHRNPQSRGKSQAGGYRHRRGRPAGYGHRRYDQEGSGGDRRGIQQSRRRPAASGLPAGGRRRLRWCPGDRRSDHPGARRHRSAHPGHAAVERRRIGVAVSRSVGTAL